MGGQSSRNKEHENDFLSDEISAVRACLPATSEPMRLSDYDSCYQYSILNSLLNARDFRMSTVRRGNLAKRPASSSCTPGLSSWMIGKGQWRHANFSARKRHERKYTSFAQGCSEIDPLWSGQRADTEYFHGIAAADLRNDGRFPASIEECLVKCQLSEEDVEISPAQTARDLKMQGELFQLLENASKSVVQCSPHETNSTTKNKGASSLELRPLTQMHKDSYAGKMSNNMLSTLMSAKIHRSTSVQSTEKLVPYDHVGSRRPLLLPSSLTTPGDPLDNILRIRRCSRNDSGDCLSSSPGADQRSLDSTMRGSSGIRPPCGENEIDALTKALEESETQRVQNATNVKTGAARLDGVPTCGEEDLAWPRLSAKSSKHPDIPMPAEDICDLLTYGYVTEAVTCG